MNLHSQKGRRIADKPWFRKIGEYVVYAFALIGFVLTAGYFAVKLGLTNSKGMIDNQTAVFINPKESNSKSPDWARGEEWQVLKSAISRDTGVIYKAARDAEIDPRLIAAELVPEQLRLFHGERELFKKFFAPLQIFGNQNQFSWGLMGIKRKTAMAIEEHLKDQL